MTAQEINSDQIELDVIKRLENYDFKKPTEVTITFEDSDEEKVSEPETNTREKDQSTKEDLNSKNEQNHSNENVLQKDERRLSDIANNSEQIEYQQPTKNNSKCLKAVRKIKTTKSIIKDNNSGACKKKMKINNENHSMTCNNKKTINTPDNTELVTRNNSNKQQYLSELKTTNEEIEFVYVNKILNKVSECILCVVKAYCSHLHFQKNSQSHEAQKSLHEFDRLKYYYFNMCFLIVENVILQNAENTLFTKRFIEDTLNIAKEKGLIYTEQQIDTCLRDLISWTKDKKFINSRPNIQQTINSDINQNNCYVSRQQLTKPPQQNTSNNATNIPTPFDNTQFPPTNVLHEVNKRPSIQFNSTTNNQHLNIESRYANTTYIPPSSKLPQNIIRKTAVSANTLNAKDGDKGPPPNFENNYLPPNSSLPEGNVRQVSSTISNTLSNYANDFHFPGMSNLPENNLSNDKRKILMEYGSPGQKVTIDIKHSVYNEYLQRLNYDKRYTSELSNGSTNHNLHNHHQRPHVLQYPSAQHSKSTIPRQYDEARHKPIAHPKSYNHQNMPQFNPYNLKPVIQSSERKPPPYHRPEILEKRYQQDCTRTASTDSGFISPINFNSPSQPQAESRNDTQTPLITHVTSLNPQVTYTVDGSCHVCGKFTKDMCVGCYKLYYCSYTCQQIHWHVHMNDCAGNKIN